MTILVLRTSLEAGETTIKLNHDERRGRIFQERKWAPHS